MRRTIEIASFLATLLVAALAAHAWLAARADQQRLQSTLAAQKQLLDAADSRERARAATLNDTLAQIDDLKRATQTPAQIVRELPQYLPLPQPITLPSRTSPAGPTTQQGTAPSEQRASEPGAPEALPASPIAQLPASDLKPLRLRPGLPRLPGPARRRQAELRRRRHQDRRPHPRTRRRHHSGQRRQFLAPSAPQCPLVCGGSRFWLRSSEALTSRLGIGPGGHPQTLLTSANEYYVS